MASNTTFTFIFKSVIEEIENSVPDKELARRTCKVLKDRELAIRKSYTHINTATKNAYMNDPSRPLDRHKCTACFMVAFLDNLPIDKNGLAEEHFAIYIGMLILKIFIRLECKGFEGLNLINFINRNNGLKFPECDCDDEPYEYNWALGIHYDRIRANDVNKQIELSMQSKQPVLYVLPVLSLSNILFLIEKHNRLLVEIENLKKLIP